MLSNEYKKVTEKAISHMHTNLHQDITTEDLAAKVGYSTYHFIRIFKDVTGVTPRHYLSALRIESSKDILLQSSSSNLKTLLSIGYRSMGTFSTRFKQFVGLSPTDFRKNSEAIVSYFEEYKQQKQVASPTISKSRPPYITSHIEIETSSPFKGLLFIGLFPRPIPDQRPVIGTAIYHTKKFCVFSDVPMGEYYVLAAGIPWGLNPKHYFINKHALRGKSPKITVAEDSLIDVNIQLRDPLPFDPPILINLPLLLFEKDRQSY